MEIDDLEYLNLDLEPQIEPSKHENIFIKQTLIHSPIFVDIFPRFLVSIGKKIKKIRGLSLEDDSDQYLALQEEDSQFGIFNDLNESQQSQKVQNDREPKPETKLECISVIVKATSLLVADIQYPLNSPVRSCCLVKGIRNHHIQEEDSLIVSLKSGFILLIRIFYVPANFHDNDYSEDFDQKLVFKPFVVQWWDTSSNLQSPSIFSNGYTLLSHCSGLAVVSTAMSGSFRIYNCDHTDLGIVLKKHYTVPVGGSIIYSCFAQPIKGSVLDDHVMFLTLVLTVSRRLELNLYGWATTEVLNESLTTSTLPLKADFPLPIFIVSLKNDGSFLFVTPTQLIIIGVHDITSAEYNFRKFDYTGSFPTNYYHPRTNIIGDSDSDEVLMSTDNGTIYSIIVSNGELSIKPIIRISDPISLFTLEVMENGYELIYASDMGLNRRLFIDKLFDSDPEPFSQSLLLSSFKNWAPILDVQIIDSFKSRNSYQNSKQEFWCISGTGKRSRLTQLRKGYCITRTTDPYQSLRKVEKMFLLKVQGATYIGCVLSFETVFLEYQEDELIEVNGAALVYDCPTLIMKMVDEVTAIQVTTSAIIVTTIDKMLFQQEFENILFADILGQFILIVSQTEFDTYKVEIFQVNLPQEGTSVPPEALNLSEDNFKIIHSSNVSCQISVAKLLAYKGMTLALGTFDGIVDLLNIETSTTSSLNLNQVSNQLSSVPQDILILNGVVLVGTKDGYLFWFNEMLEIQNQFKLSDVDVNIYEADHQVIVNCKSLWIIDFSSQFPEPILFDEKNDKLVKTILPLQDHKYLIVRDEGLSIASISDVKMPNVRQINLGESAKKLIYLTYLSVFVLLSSSKNPRARLRFVDRKTYKLLSHQEISRRPDSVIFDDEEIPLCGKIWSLDRLGKNTKKLLIGCSKPNGGSFKILDIIKVIKDNKPSIRMVQLIEFDHKQPITCIEQVDSNIIFSSGNQLYSTVYNTDEKRLNPITELLTLSSDIISISVENDKLISIVTKLDSVYQFEFVKEEYKDTLQFLAADTNPKSIVNQVIDKSQVIVSDKYHSDILIMSRYGKSLVMDCKFKTSGISRVFKGNFEYFWMDDSSGFVSVTVDGEITLFKKIDSDSKEYKDLKRNFSRNDSIHLPTQIWDAAFADKVTGKGFKSINKPYFRNIDNKVDLIDYDLEEISRVCKSYGNL